MARSSSMGSPASKLRRIEKICCCWVLGVALAALPLSCASPPHPPPELPAASPSASDAAQNEVGGPGWVTSPSLSPAEQEAASARTLFQQLLTPGQEEDKASTILALIRIGKPASDLLLKVLADKDAQISALVRQIQPSNPRVHVEQAAVVLGSIGRKDAIEPLMAALKVAASAEERHLCRLALFGLPSTPASLQLLQKEFEELSAEAESSGGDGRGELAQEFARLMDPAVVPWMIQQVNHLSKERNNLPEVRDHVILSSLLSLARLMKKEQISSVEKLVKHRHEVVIVTFFGAASKHLLACENDLACHLDKLVEAPTSRPDPMGNVGIRAAYSLGALGNEATRAELVKKLPQIKHNKVREAVLFAIDRLSPDGDVATAKALSALLEHRPAAWAPDDDEVLQLVALRLRARAM